VPENRDIVARNTLILRCEGQGFDARLGNQHAVERVVVVAWQAAGRDGVGGQDRQWVETHAAQDVAKTIDREFEAAEGVLDGDFPGRDGTDEDLVFRRCQGCTRLRVELGRVRYRPDVGGRVEQRFRALFP
jgi:hypothetical protein